MEVNRALAPYVDVMLGNEEDFTAALGFEVAGVDGDLAELDPANFRAMIAKVVAAYPDVQVAAHAAPGDDGQPQRLDGDRLCHGAFHQATTRRDLDILDRVGGGDGFASGLVYALLGGKPPRRRRGVRCHPRGTRHDHTRGHVDGLAPGGGGRDAGPDGPRGALMSRTTDRRWGTTDG